MSKMKVAFFATLVSLVFMLAACGGGGSSSGTPVGSGGASGIAVDPYIVGAVFQEIDADGNVVQTSTPSGADGAFTFAENLTAGNTVIMSTPGLHNGLPFKGTLKRVVGSGDEDTTIVVSPLTTLAAEAGSDSAVIGALAAAGFSGITAEDIYADPMAAVTAGDSTLALAAIAVNTALNSGDDSFSTTLAIVAEVLTGPDLETAAGDSLADLIDTAVVLANFMSDEIEDAIQEGTDIGVALTEATASIDATVIEGVVTAVTDPSSTAPVILDEELQTVTATVAEYLAAGFADLETFAGATETGSVTSLLDSIENFQSASALVGVDTTATLTQENQALFFSSLTRLASLADPYSDLVADNGLNDLGDLLDAFGVSTDNRMDFATQFQIENCVETPAYDEFGQVVGVEYIDCTLPEGTPTSGELKQMLTQKVGAGLDAAIADLDLISSSFDISWTAPGDIAPTDIDYSDVLMFKGIAQAMKAYLNLLEAYDFNLDIYALQQQVIAAEETQTELSPNDVLDANPTFGTLVDAQKLTDTKTYIGQATATIKQAVNAIVAEVGSGDGADQEDDLISFYDCYWDGYQMMDVCGYDATAAPEILSALEEIQAGLNSGVSIDVNGTPEDLTDDVIFNFYKFFDGFDFRSQLPEIVETETDIMLGDFPDPTLNGIVDPSKVDINEDQDGDGYPDLANDFTYFFADMIAEQQVTSYFGWEDGYANEQFSFSSNGTFSYSWYMYQFSTFSESFINGAGGSWTIVNGDLILTFAEPIDSWNSAGQIDGITIDLERGGYEWADVYETHTLQGTPVQLEPVWTNWGFGYGAPM